MEKIIIVMVLVLCACTTQPPTKIVYQTVDIPIEYTPKPPRVDRPVLAIDTIVAADQKKIGVLSEAYVITVEQLENYSEKLEKIIATYDDLSKKNIIVPAK